MQSRRGRGAKSAATLAFANLGVDPVLGKKFCGNLPKRRIESRERVEDYLLCLIIAEGSDFFADRRVLIVQREPWKLEHCGFEAEVVVRQAVVFFRHGHHDSYGFAVDFIG